MGGASLTLYSSGESDKACSAASVSASSTLMWIIALPIDTLRLDFFLLCAPSWGWKIRRSPWWQNQQNELCAQRRLRSAWESTQSNQSLHCAPALWVAKDPNPLLLDSVVSDKLGGCPADLRLRWAVNSFVGVVVLRLKLYYISVSKLRIILVPEANRATKLFSWSTVSFQQLECKSKSLKVVSQVVLYT